jgi:hypothetical protein
MEAQFETGATQDTRIFTGCWAIAAGAPPSDASAANPRRKVVNLRIVFSSRLLRLVARLRDVGTGDGRCQLQFQRQFQRRALAIEATGPGPESPLSSEPAVRTRQRREGRP